MTYPGTTHLTMVNRFVNCLCFFEILAKINYKKTFLKDSKCLNVDIFVSKQNILLGKLVEKNII
jgi:hypothetical protein